MSDMKQRSSVEREADHSVLREAQDLVYGARNAAYGHPLEDFARTAKIWSAILGAEVTAEQVGLCMVGLKISRECHRPGRDNLVDMAGYAETVRRVRAARDHRTLAEETFGPLTELDEALRDVSEGAERPCDVE